MALDVIELRAYARAKRAVEQAEAAGKTADLPDDPMIATVYDVQFAIAKDRIANAK